MEPHGPAADGLARDAAGEPGCWGQSAARQHAGEHAPPAVVRGEGTILYDDEGRGYIDGDASMGWVVHGHHHPVIDAAVRAQREGMAEGSPRGREHQPAIALAERLAAVVPPGLTRVQFYEHGSAAVQAALTMTDRGWRERGAERGPRDCFIGLRGAQHGDRPGASGDARRFEVREAEPGDSDDMGALLDAHGERVCAVVVEPLVQVGAGVLVHPPGYLRAVRELCDAHGIPLICDEVATGFGRTGRMVACEHDDVVPDLLCLGGGLTGGCLPLGAVVATDAMPPAPGDDHGGDPLACAAALASLEVFERERTLERLQPRIDLLGKALNELVRPLPAVAAIRRGGFVCGVELRNYPAAARMAQRVSLAARRHGAVVPAIGDVLVLMPPLSIPDAELRRLLEITSAAIAEATAAPLPVAA